MKEGRIRVIHNHSTFAWRGGARRVAGMPDVVGKYYVVRQFGGHLLDEEQQAKPTGVRAGIEFTLVELRHNVVNVENNSGTTQLWDQRRENEKVRRVVNMHDAIA